MRLPAEAADPDATPRQGRAGRPWRHQHLSTGLECPARANEAVELAETLGRALERDRTGIEPFDWAPWDQLGGRRVRWEARGGRGRSAEDSRDRDYRQPLATLQAIKDLQPAHLLLWWASMPEQLPQPARSRLVSCECRPFFSLVSLWDVAIKASLGRTDFQVNPSALRMGLLREGYQQLPVQSERVLAVHHLPWIPFS